VPKTRTPHRWDLTPAEAIALQTRLARRVVRVDRLGPVRRVCGIDVGFEDDGRVTRAAAAVLSFPELKLVDFALARRPTAFPYIPGLLSFREAPAALEALGALRVVPDLLLCDGQGVAHPRRCGIASHIGVLAAMPSIGVAKTRLVGAHGRVPARRGAWAPLTDGGERIGAVLRTRAGVNPLYVSSGHRVSLESAVRWVMACTTRYRLPETTRWAHRLASAPERELAARIRTAY
jgi:deoxyribonuclease V